MTQASRTRNLSVALMIFSVITVSAQARLGSHENEAIRPGTLAQILETIKSLVLPEEPSRDHRQSKLAALPETWPIDKEALHEQLLAMIRESLTHDIIIGESEGGRNSEQVFMLYVPDNAVRLELSTRGGNGDIDLYVMRGNIPTTARYDCRSTAAGTRQHCTIDAPAEGVYYVMLRGNLRYSGVSVMGAYTLDMARATPPFMDSTEISATDKRLESSNI